MLIFNLYRKMAWRAIDIVVVWKSVQTISWVEVDMYHGAEHAQKG